MKDVSILEIIVTQSIWQGLVYIYLERKKREKREYF